MTWLLSFSSGGRKFALSAREVKEVLLKPALDPAPQGPAWLEGYLPWGQARLPAIRLCRLLGLPDDPGGLYQHLLVLENLALAVERALDVFDGELNPRVPCEQRLHPAVAALATGDAGEAVVLSGRRIWEAEMGGGRP